MSAAPDLAAVIAELRDMAERATALADLLSAPVKREGDRTPAQPEVGEVVERGPAIDEEIKFSHISTEGF